MATSHLRSILWEATKFSRPFVVGVIHVPALPGTPNSSWPIAQIVSKVKKDARIFAAAKVDGILVENTNDIPYLQEKHISPEITSSMTRVSMAVNEALGDRCNEFARGIQILAAANHHAIAVAHTCEFDFIRAESYSFSHVADEGLMSACAGELQRYRRNIGAERVAIITDIKKKHSSHAITSDLTVGDIAEASDFMEADGLVITGRVTGRPANVNDLIEVSKRSKLPLFIGSGLTNQNMREYFSADGFIVGSYFKENGDWRNNLDEKKVRNFMQKIRSMKRDQNND